MVCEATKPDIVCIVETWLDDRVSDSEISLDSYSDLTATGMVVVLLSMCVIFNPRAHVQRELL